MSTPTFPERLPSADGAAAPPPPPPPIAAIVAELGQGPIRGEDVAGLSDLDRARAAEWAAGWPALPESSREAVVRAMDALAEERLDVHFGRALRLALGDESAAVRQLAVAALWEDEQDDLPGRLMALAGDDPSLDVRAEAAKGLARFAARAAVGELDDAVADEIQRTLVGIAADGTEARLVRRRALESAGVFGQDGRLSALILEAMEEDDDELRSGALYAMGASRDPRWLDALLAATRSPEADVRYEAARACGLLEDERAVGELAGLVLDEDVEVRQAAIAALGVIGGRAAVRTLGALLEAEDAPESDVELIEAAMEEAATSVEPLRASS